MTLVGEMVVLVVAGVLLEEAMALVDAEGAEETGMWGWGWYRLGMVE